MKTFQEWMEERHPEAIEEGLMKKILLGGALAAAGVGALGGCEYEQPSKGHPPAVICHGAAPPRLREAAKRAGIPESEWGKLRGEKIGNVYISVNGREVPLNKREKEHVQAVERLSHRMGR